MRLLRLCYTDIQLLQYTYSGEYKDRMTLEDWPRDTYLESVNVIESGQIVKFGQSLIVVTQWQGNKLSESQIDAGSILCSSLVEDGIVFSIRFISNYYFKSFQA